MLSSKEKRVMDYIYNECVDKQSSLIAPSDIQNAVKPKYDLTDVEVDQFVNNLMIEEYIDVVNSDKNGNLIYCISLKTKGEGYMREKENRKKQIYTVLFRTVILACISFTVTLILKAIFKF